MKLEQARKIDIREELFFSLILSKEEKFAEKTMKESELEIMTQLDARIHIIKNVNLI